MPHKGICPLLKQWRKVAKGKEKEESAGLRQEMVEYLRAAVSASPGGSAMAAPSAGGEQENYGLGVMHERLAATSMLVETD